MGKQTIFFKNKPCITGFYTIAGIKEGQGNFKEYFDYILKNDKFDEKSYEFSERKIIEHSIVNAVDKAKMQMSDIDMIVSGDLLNQLISSTFSARKFDTMHLGLYSACSTMSESLAVAACLIDGKHLNNIACCTGSHFSTVERQFRFPLELGNQRPPTTQWTVTGAGCTILSQTGSPLKIASATFGKVTDYGIKDTNNMGAAMAPAAMSTIISHFIDTNSTPDDYDLIVTGDLGKLGSELFNDLMENKGYVLKKNHCDCGQMIFSGSQNTFQGGSGSGCSALVLNSYVFKKMLAGEYKRVLFAATGAMLSSLSSQQGESIPGICHAVEIVCEV